LVNDLGKSNFAKKNEGKHYISARLYWSKRSLGTEFVILYECLVFFLLRGGKMDSMKPSERRYLEDEDTPPMKVIKATTSGLVAGTIWGTVVATWHDVPRVERRVALPGLIRTLKMM